MRLPLSLLVLPLASLAACSDQGFGSLTFDDTFVQPDVELSTDVLFVVDDSASMEEEQDRLASNFGAFVEVLASSYADWQVGVVTTDVDVEGAGALRGGLLTADTPDLDAAFRAAVVAGTDGSRDEQGLSAAVLAVDATRNPGFVRAGSRFNVVFVSDEDDHSPADVQTYLDRLGAAAGAGFAAHALVGDLPAGCASGTSAADPGGRYLDAADVTLGFVESICADDYTGLLTRVGLDVTGLADTFALSRLPSEDSLEVRVEDVLIPERDEDGWTYSLGDNAIVFHGRAVPRAGMEIVVTYQKWLGPAPE
ncbi:MAG: hypothetical protein Q8P41_11475 [Pseudomonadota bacterium]|nr:hypothetical protein [Pseudomonadota bacterium]